MQYSNILILITTLLFSCHPQQKKEQPQKSRIQISKTKDLKNQSFNNREYFVLLPKSYATSEEKRYPVLYMMDGQNLIHDSLSYSGFSWRIDKVVDSLVAKNKMEEIIIVGINNAQEKRFAEYMPQSPLKSLQQERLDSMKRMIQHDVYSDEFLSDFLLEIKSTIDKNYRTKSSAEHTIIGGSSMGGLISMYALNEFPEVFGGAMCLSTHWIIGFDDSANDISQSVINYFGEKIKSDKKWYFDFGTKGLDAYYEPWQNKIDSILQQYNYVNGKNWLTQKFEGQDHNEKSWNSRLHIPLEFFFGKEN